MATKRKMYTGDLPAVPTKQIYLNVKHLEKGVYTIQIIDQNKVIKQINFEK